ncbi:IS1595 family transposase, partial [Coriobacteriales bacterium OH1046]
RLVKYQGIAKEDFYLHLKECEFRFNMRGRDMYKFLLKEFRERPLN